MEDMPTGIGLNILFIALPGVKAFGTKIFGAVLNTLTIIAASPTHPAVSVTFAMYLIESMFDPSRDTGFEISGLSRPVTGPHSKESPPAFDTRACNCRGWFTTTDVSFPANTFGGCITVIVCQAESIHPLVDTY